MIALKREIKVRDIQKKGSRYKCCIHGECASMKNSRKPALRRKRNGGYTPVLLKKEKAQVFQKLAKLQLRPLKELIDSPIRVWFWVYYKEPAADLDEALVMDSLEGIIYTDDILIFEKHVYKRFSASDPRVEIEVEVLSDGEVQLIQESLTDLPRRGVNPTLVKKKRGAIDGR